MSSHILPSKTSDLSSSHYIDGKYSDIYEKRRQIENIRFDPNIPNEQKVEILKVEFENLNRLEHDLLLLQKESYNTLEEELDLDSIKLVIGFPKYIQHDLTSNNNISTSNTVIRDDSSISSSGTGSSGINTVGGLNPFVDVIVGRGRSRTLDHNPFTKATSLGAMSQKDTFRYHENKYEAKKLKDEIRELRAELLLLKRKKKMSDLEEERTIELEDQIKDKESSILKV
ncbi:predicted protein [Naegleria gruberi]|uniref:Predicted protein n=1 Tax=Naegleria gruberi TaxID=5762 RepID=D2VEQ8_NAEGR|nr:uncharacterized protein NAEGRDRAFT_67359 [Naegleria gruberi]EFC44550.1 predicted protein [Naegleria gruberi]|eukprot:XP_002677294.1 predicted protein [Naegleria gruberi strain NEG-M]